MLTFAAALVPILASLYVGASFLIGAVKRAHEVRVYARINDWYEAERKKLDGRPDAVERAEELSDRRRALFEHNGVPAHYGTLSLLGRMTHPQPIPAVDIRRQWVAMAGALLGVILLSIDQLTASI